MNIRHVCTYTALDTVAVSWHSAQHNVIAAGKLTYFAKCSRQWHVEKKNVSKTLKTNIIYFSLSTTPESVFLTPYYLHVTLLERYNAAQMVKQS